MVASTRKNIFWFLLLLVSFQSFGQGHLFSEVNIDRSKVYVGEPVEVSIGIYTSTWFTKGLNFGNIKVNGAFTVYFRSVSTSKQVNGKNYAGVIAIYNVFPYDNDDLIFPELEFSVETPNEGDSKGVKRLVKTRSRTITVKPVPSSYESDQWLVSSNVNVNESWQGDLNNLKVGDVVQRSIFRRAYGTVSELIPPIVWDSIDGVSFYPSRAEIKSDKTKTSISASRSDAVRYLFEKEGNVNLPEITITWWNPRQNKLFKRTLKSRTVKILPNPDLGMLESVRDSLLLKTAVVNEENQEDAEMKIWGLSLKEFITYLILAGLICYILFRIFKWVFITKGVLTRLKNRRQEYLKSEKYFFKIFLSLASEKNLKESTNALYNWLDRLNLKEPTLYFFATQYGSSQFIAALNKDVKKDVDLSPYIAEIKKARTRYLRKGQNDLLRKKNWINP